MSEKQLLELEDDTEGDDVLEQSSSSDFADEAVESEFRRSNRARKER